MAAPSTAYLNNGNAIRMDEEDLAAAVINSYDALIAAYIYGASDIKALFYLDAIVEVQMTDDAGSVLGTGFIGLVIPLGFNYQFHAVGRRYKGTLPVYDDAGNLITDHIALNDGGLNTLGRATQPGAQSDTSIRAKITTLNWKTAYYVNSDEVGYIIKQSSAAPSYTYDPRFVVQLNVAANTSPSASSVTIGNADAWITLYCYTFNKNVEGIYICPTARTFYLYGDPITLSRQSTKPTSSGEVTGIDETFYTNGDTTNGFPSSKLSSDQTGFVAVTDNFYVSRIKERWYQVSAGLIIDQGTYTTAPSGYAYYDFYAIATLSCGATSGVKTTLTLSSPPTISSGVVAPSGLGNGNWKNTDSTKVFSVYQSLECPDGGISCAESDKIIVYRIGTVTNC